MPGEQNHYIFSLLIKSQTLVNLNFGTTAHCHAKVKDLCRKLAAVTDTIHRKQ